VLNTLGGAYHFAGARDKALDAWQRALKIDPNHADSLVNIGLVKWREQGDATAAIAAWRQMLKCNPQHPQRAQVEKMIAQAEKHAGMAARSGN
jgi:cytochrome c-type biogenesis protein CcmH/NrfG